MRAPVILNPESSFVFVTYWWGRGELNPNTGRPCVRDVDVTTTADLDPKPPESFPYKSPIRYEQVAHRWVEQFRRLKCNYLIQEYKLDADDKIPRLSPQTNRIRDVPFEDYQVAINYKPQFIIDARKQCYPRNVVWLDTDVIVNSFPEVFDLFGRDGFVDFMALGWNFDTRIAANVKCRSDPFVFETGGPMLFFNQTPQATKLLETWNLECVRHPTKADDRLLNLVFNRDAMHTQLTTLQLPIEYLFFRDDAIDLSQRLGKDFLRTHIGRLVIEHPECLTEESTVTKMNRGEHVNRIPAGYTNSITKHVECRRGSPRKLMRVYEYILFECSSHVHVLHRSLRAIADLGGFELVEYSERYGPKLNQIASRNLARARDLATHKYTHVIKLDVVGSVMGSTTTRQRVSTIPSTKVSGTVVIIDVASTSANDVIPLALAALKHKHVVVMTKRFASIQPQRLSDAISAVLPLVEHHHHHVDATNLDFVCRNKNRDSSRRYKPEYYLELDDDSYPLVFSPRNRVTLQLLTMCDGYRKIEKVFNSTFLFLTLMRCRWM